MSPQLRSGKGALRKSMGFAPRAFAFAPWSREAHRSAIPRPGRGRERTGSSDNAALMSWSDKRAAGDMGQSARWSTSRVQSARSLPLAHAPGTPLAPAHNEMLSRRPRPPAPATLRGSSSGLGPTVNRWPNWSVPRSVVAPRVTGRACARPAPRSAHSAAAEANDSKIHHKLEAWANRCCNSATSVKPRKPSRPFSSTRARL